MITGRVTYGNSIGAPTPRFVSNVTINGAGPLPVSALTSFPDGTYSLSGFGAGSYTITPSKTGGVNSSISSFDAALVAQYAASVITLSTAQRAAADVSGDGGISSFDAALVARYAVAAPGPVGLSGTWKFGPTSMKYASVDADVTGANFEALLMGEVSGNWTNTGARTAGSFGSKRLEVGNGPERGIAVEMPYVSVGMRKEIAVPVNVRGIANKEVISYEFNLRYDPLVIQPIGDGVDVKATASRGLSVVTNANEPGLLRVVVYGAFPIDEDGVLLNLRFTAVGVAGSVSPISFERLMFNEGEPRVSVVDGKVELF